MRILAFDPGHQTGVAFINDSGECRIGMTVDTRNVDDKLLRNLVDVTQPHVVVIEEPPLRIRDEVTTSVYDRLVQWFQIAGIQVKRVNPGQWKGMGLRITGLSYQHPQDAAQMAYWFWRKQSNPLTDIFTEEEEDGQG